MPVTKPAAVATRSRWCRATSSTVAAAVTPTPSALKARTASIESPVNQVHPRSTM